MTAQDACAKGSVPMLPVQGEFGGGGGRINALSWRGDGKFIAGALDDGRVVVWDVPDAQPLISLSGHEGAVTSVRFSPEGRYLASTSRDATVRVWNVEDRNEEKLFRGPTAFRRIDWDPSGKFLLALQTKRVHFWQVEMPGPPKILFEHEKWARCALWLTPHRIVSCGDDGQLIFWDTSSLKRAQQMSIEPAGLSDIAMMSQTAQQTVLAVATQRGTVQMWRTMPTVLPLDQLVLSSARLVNVAISRDQKLLATLDESGRLEVVLLDAGTRAAAASVDAPSTQYAGRLVDFHPLRPWLAVAAGNSVRLFRYDSLQFERAAATGTAESVRRSSGSRTPVVTQSPSLADVAHPATKRQVFFSYSSKDRKTLDLILKMLEPLVRSGEVLPWDDSKIQTGDWNRQIEDAMRASAVAVFLVSAEFMASKFINSSELPTLLDRAREGGVTITWLMLEPALYDRSGLEAFQCFRDIKHLHSPERPLSMLSSHQRKTVLAEFCKSLSVLVGGP